MIGPTEVIIVVAAAVFLFGGKKVVDWARDIGTVKKEYNKALEEESEKPKKRGRPKKEKE